MTPETRELFRQCLIKLLAAAGALGLSLAHLRIGVKADGFSPTDKEITDAIDYLIGKALVMAIDKRVSPELGRWKLTSEGYDFAAQHGLA